MVVDIFQDFENAKPIATGGNFLQIKAKPYNPIKRKKILKVTTKYTYKLTPTQDHLVNASS